MVAIQVLTAVSLLMPRRDDEASHLLCVFCRLLGPASQLRGRASCFHDLRQSAKARRRTPNRVLIDPVNRGKGFQQSLIPRPVQHLRGVVQAECLQEASCAVAKHP